MAARSPAIADKVVHRVTQRVQDKVFDELSKSNEGANVLRLLLADDPDLALIDAAVDRALSRAFTPNVTCLCESCGSSFTIPPTVLTDQEGFINCPLCRTLLDLQGDTDDR